MAVITISRQFGAGGKTLGKMVADKFGYTFADSEIIKMVAEMANVSTHFVETVEKEAGGKFSKFISKTVSKPLLERILKDERGYIDEEIYLDYLVLIIAQMADDANAMFENELKRLEKRVDALVQVCDQLKDENRSLKQRQDTLTAERATLLQKNEQVRARVEGMIGRLKAMEQGG